MSKFILISLALCPWLAGLISISISCLFHELSVEAATATISTAAGGGAAAAAVRKSTIHRVLLDEQQYPEESSPPMATAMEMEVPDEDKFQPENDGVIVDRNEDFGITVNNDMGPPIVHTEEQTLVDENDEKEIVDEDTKNFIEQDALDNEDDLGEDLTDNPIFLDPTKIGMGAGQNVVEGELEGQAQVAESDSLAIEEDEYMDVNNGMEKLSKEAENESEEQHQDTSKDKEEQQVPLITSSSTIYPSSHRSAWVAHGTVGAIIFGLLVPVAISSALFRDLIPSYWIYIHVCVNVITFAMTFFTVGIAFATMNGMGDAGEGHMKEVHHIVGLLLLMLVSFQTANGFLRPPREFVTDDEHDTTPGAILRSKLGEMKGLSTRALWYLVHRLSGLLIFVLGAYQVRSGLGLFASRFGTPDWGSVYLGYILWLAGIVVVAKVYFFIQGRRNKTMMRDLEMHVEGGSIINSGSRGTSSGGIHSNLRYDAESDFAVAQAEHA